MTALDAIRRFIHSPVDTPQVCYSRTPDGIQVFDWLPFWTAALANLSGWLPEFEPDDVDGAKMAWAAGIELCQRGELTENDIRQEMDRLMQSWELNGQPLPAW